jgi:hypothetical protein
MTVLAAGGRRGRRLILPSMVGAQKTGPPPRHGPDGGRLRSPGA